MNEVWIIGNGCGSHRNEVWIIGKGCGSHRNGVWIIGKGCGSHRNGVCIIGKGCGSHRNVTRSFGHSVTVVQIIINRTYSINYKVDRAGNQVSKLQKNNHKQSERITMGSIKLSSAL